MSNLAATGYTGSGGMVMDEIAYKPLDLKKLHGKKHVTVSSEEALKDVIPIEWDDDVVSGNKKVLLTNES
ncbi:MAG: hypothetical protein FWE42_09480 [Defluviitaleaceae bacterium]|nr:hypothetical protein [Defluviitaleaceae bacterium]